MWKYKIKWCLISESKGLWINKIVLNYLQPAAGKKKKSIVEFNNLYLLYDADQGQKKTLDTVKNTSDSPAICAQMSGGSSRNCNASSTELISRPFHTCWWLIPNITCSKAGQERFAWVQKTITIWSPFCHHHQRECVPGFVGVCVVVFSDNMDESTENLHCHAPTMRVPKLLSFVNYFSYSIE